MKKIFTLVALAAFAVGVNAQDDEEKKLFEAAEITMGDITWKNGNNKLDINDAAQTKLYFVMGQGNAYEEIFAEEVENNQTGEIEYRPYYTYTEYLKGETGLPKYGLYYKFTPAVAGQLKVLVWVNKGNRSTVVVKGSTGAPMVMGTDYKAEGYVNGKRANYTTPAIDPETNEPKLDNQGNPVYEQYQIFFNAEQIDSVHNDYCYSDYNKYLRENEETAGTHTDEELAAAKAKGDTNAEIWRYVLAHGNQAFWGWITFDVEAGESYYVFQLSSQLGFGGYDFTPAGGAVESYVAAPEGELAAEFKAVVDENGVATNVGTTGRSVVAIKTANVAVEAVGSATPTDVVPGKDLTTAISTVKAAVADAPVYNLAGQRVNANAKGLLIKNGKKFINK